MFKRKKKVPVTPPALPHVEEIDVIYEGVRQLLGLSGYASVTKEGGIHYEKFPVNVQENMPLYDVFKQRVIETEKKYQQAQADTIKTNDFWRS